MVAPMLRPNMWGGLVTHAGDALFEVCCSRSSAPPLALSARTTRGLTKSSRRTSQPTGDAKESDGVLLNNWCMAACYSADEVARVGSRSTSRPVS